VHINSFQKFLIHDFVLLYQSHTFRNFWKRAPPSLGPSPTRNSYTIFQLSATKLRKLQSTLRLVAQLLEKLQTVCNYSSKLRTAPSHWVWKLVPFSIWVEQKFRSVSSDPIQTRMKLPLFKFLLIYFIFMLLNFIIFFLLFDTIYKIYVTSF